MSNTVLQATARTGRGKNAAYRLRASGRLPAALYGQGIEPVPLAVDPRAVVQILESPAGRNTLLDLQIEGEDTPRLALIQEVQVHPWKRRILHVDLWQVRPDQLITRSVPITGDGHAPSEKLGALVRRTMRELRVRCLPEALPAAIHFDLSQVPLTQDAVTVSEVVPPEGVTIQYKHDFAVFQLQVPRVETEVAEEEGEDAAEATDEA